MVYANEFEWTLFLDFVYTLNYEVYMILDNVFLENGGQHKSNNTTTLKTKQKDKKIHFHLFALNYKNYINLKLN